jgi:pyruvate dehydrogenase E1 component
LAADVPEQLSNFNDKLSSTQETFGRILYRLTDHPELSSRLVTASPDVSVSTNLTGWINKRGAFNLMEKVDYDSDPQRLLKWKRGPTGQHIELGISEMNLFLLLGMFGLSAEQSGQLTIPIGTVYDPFICRGLDALIYALYSQAKFIFAGTPSGISLSPEGGAHQSTITPSIGTELPNLRMYEPGFAMEVDWILLDSIRECFNRQHGRATYLRLSTRQVEQSLLQPALERLGEARLRQQVLAGGYRLRDWRDAGPDVDSRYIVQIATSGAMLTEACAAAQALWSEGVAANVLNLTSPRRLYETWQSHAGVNSAANPWDWLILPEERRFPIVTIHDGASHALAWLGSVFGAPVHALGVDEFGQSGTRQDLYNHFHIDSEAIVTAAFDILDQTVGEE